MPSRWSGRSRAFTSWGARPRCTRCITHHESCCVPPRPRKAEVRRARPQRFPSSHAHRAWRGGVGGGGRLGTFAAMGPLTDPPPPMPPHRCAGGGEQSAVILTSPPNPLALHSTAAADRRARRDRRRGRLSLLRRLELHYRPDHRRRRRRHHRGGVNSSSDIYVIGPFGSPLPLQSLHFPGPAASRAGILDGEME
jgi:hypothetical protein